VRSSAFIPPCIPTLRDRLPKGEGWLFEVKFDGYRVQVHKAGDRITLYTRNGADWTSRFPLLAADLTSLPWALAIIDAEPPACTSFRAPRAEGGYSPRPRPRLA
jgi:bifunctional non-homologous end joining protein LigD